jgi:uncharacterized protein YbjT (DUF2867 family)
MTKVLILGANGQLARNTTQVFLETTDVYLTLYLRRASRLRNPDPSRVKIVEGDVFDAVALRIYGEVPDETYRSVLDPYRDSAAEIEKSDLDYTILRPGWFTRDKAGVCRITQKGEPFKGHEVSLDSLSDLIARLATTPGLHLRRSIGVSTA